MSAAATGTAAAATGSASAAAAATGSAAAAAAAPQGLTCQFATSPSIPALDGGESLLCHISYVPLTRTLRASVCAVPGPPCAPEAPRGACRVCAGRHCAAQAWRWVRCRLQLQVQLAKLHTVHNHVHTCKQIHVFAFVSAMQLTPCCCFSVPSCSACTAAERHRVNSGAHAGHV